MSLNCRNWKLARGLTVSSEAGGYLLGTWNGKCDFE